MKELHNDRAMDQALNDKVAELARHADETGDGIVDAADLKSQLDRIEAQLELQDAQNRTLLRHSRLRFCITAALAIVLCVFLGLMWVKMTAAYDEVMTTCDQITQLSESVQQTLDSLNTDDLNALLEQLPLAMEKLNQLDTESLNEVMERLPQTMDSLNALQKQFAGLSSLFGGLAGGR